MTGTTPPPLTLDRLHELADAGTVDTVLVGTELESADVVEHYVNAARIEQAAFDAAVTDWERQRGFERL